MPLTPDPVGIIGKLSIRDSIQGSITLPTVVDGHLEPATTEKLGGIIVGEDLSITESGVLSVIKSDRAEEDNTHPITAAAVYTEIGNIDALLQTI